MNRATLTGNCGKDPEIKVLQDGGKVARFPLATSEHWTDKQTGEKKEHTEWHTIIVWNEKLIDAVVAKYVKKGTKLLVEGAIKTRKWTDDKGIDRYSTEIVLQGFDARIELLTQPQPRPGDAPLDESAAPPFRSGAPSDSQRPLNNDRALNGGVSSYQKTLDDEIPF